MPSLFLFHPVYTTAIRSQVLGVTVGPMVDPSDRFGSIEGWYVLARRARTQAPDSPDG